MEPFGIGMAGLGAAGLATLGAFGLAFRLRRWRLAASAAPGAMAAGSRGMPRTTGERLEAMAAAQAEIGQRLDALAAQAAAPEERLQAMAGQLLGLIRDKNATLETALAGLDQLRARMRAIEQIGAPAEARGLIDGLGQRLGALEAAQAAAAAGTEARLAALDGSGATAADFARAVAELGERLARLQEARDTRFDGQLEAALARIAPLETRLGLLDGGRSEGREALKRLEARIEALGGEGAAARSDLRAELAALKAEVQGAALPAQALAAEVARLHDRREAGLEAVIARLAALEHDRAARDPEALIDARIEFRLESVAAPLDARLAALAERLARAEDRAADPEPLAALAGQLAALQAARDATAETVLARLGPVESRLAAFEAALAASDPQGALDRFAERLEAVAGRMTALEGAGRSATEVSERLAELYRQKDAALEALVTRLAPLEARLAEIDPQGTLDRFAERLEAVAGRVGTLEGAENPVAEISERLAGILAQKDAAVETLVTRLAPLEARLAEIDPQGTLDRFAERLEAVAGRVGTLEGAENPVAEISERLAGILAQKDAAVETLVARLAPLEARLAEIDPQGTLDRFAERLEAVAGRVGTLEGAENPVAEISERLAGILAQKDAAVETLVARLAPLEARLAEIDPQGTLDRFAERLEAVAGRVGTLEGAENPVAEISERLAGILAQKDAAVETLVARLAPLEARLAEVEGGVARVLPLAEEDPRAALAALKARIEGLDHAQEAVAVGLEGLRAGLARAAAEEAAAEGHAAGIAAGTAAGTVAALAEVVDGMTRLFAQKDAGLAALLARLAPLEARLPPLEERLVPLEERLAAVEARPRDAGVAEAVEEAVAGAVAGAVGEAAGAAAEAEAARAEARAVAARLAEIQAAAEASAERAALFADRISELEATLPRLSAAEARAMAAADADIATGTEPDTEDRAAPAPVTAALDALRDLPRVISLHQK